MYPLLACDSENVIRRYLLGRMEEDQNILKRKVEGVKGGRGYNGREEVIRKDSGGEREGRSRELHTQADFHSHVHIQLRSRRFLDHFSTDQLQLN